MRVLINAQLDPVTSGGIAQSVLGLAHGFANLDTTGFELVFVCSPESAEWLRPHAGGQARIEVNRRPKLPLADGVRESDGFWESLRPNVVHFPYQSFTRLSVPTIFSPHDLQHVHLPEFFTAAEVRRREALFAHAFQLADAIVAPTNWVRDDIVRHYDPLAEKIQVASFGSPAEFFGASSGSAVADVLTRHGLRPGYAIYPAQTWPHKNHLRLLEALHHARTKLGCRIPLVCTGHHTEHYGVLRERTGALGLGDQVRFLGRVSPSELACLYSAARMTILPSLFEGGGFPILESFSFGIPLACANVASLPEVAGDAALFFDPLDAQAMAEAAVRLYTDAKLREELIRRAQSSLSQFSWSRTAQIHLDLYSKIISNRTAPRRWPQCPITTETVS